VAAHLEEEERLGEKTGGEWSESIERKKERKNIISITQIQNHLKSNQIIFNHHSSNAIIIFF